MFRRVIQKSIMLTVVVVPLLGTVLAIILLWQRAVNWRDVAWLLGLYSAVAFGVTVGLHRMLTHRSFETNPIVKAIFLILGSMAIEGPVIDWAANHTKHHAYADKEGDPHSPLEGFFHAHMGWMFSSEQADPEIYCKHLLDDPLVVFMNRTFFVWAILGLALPFAFDGWTGLLWGGLVRIFLTHHITWSVNSVCHTFGKRPFKTTDASRNEWIVGLLAFGEGWHNNHHAFPRSAFHGLRWWQFDLSGYTIWLMEKVKLVHHVYRVTPELLRKRLEQSRSKVAANAQ